MKSLLSLLGRYALTLGVVALATVIALKAWDHDQRTPWTRDARVGVDVVQIAPEVSGTVLSVPVADNQYVSKGDILYRIDPKRLELAVALAEAEGEAKRQEMVVRKATARRHGKLKNVLSREAVQQTIGAAAVAGAAYQAALAALDLARLDLALATVRSPTDGYVTHLRLRPGDYATAGATKVPVLDASSFRVTGYFEETRLRRIHVGDAARVRLMGYEQTLHGRVESIGRGIDNSNDTPGSLGLPDVAATFSWVRLAQRVPVRIRIDPVPAGVELVAGITATVEIIPADDGAGADQNT